MSVSMKLASEYANAEGFYVGEMEMRRKPLWGPRPRNWWHCLTHELYRSCSAYGTSYPQAAAVLLLLLVVSAVLIIFFGFRLAAARDQPAGGIIRYYHALAVPPLRVIPDMLRALVLAFSGRLGPYEPVGESTRVVLLAVSLLVALQSGILLLAIRRNFRR